MMNIPDMLEFLVGKYLRDNPNGENELDIKFLNQYCEDNGLELMLLEKNQMITTDYVDNRLNVVYDKDTKEIISAGLG